ELKNDHETYVHELQTQSKIQLTELQVNHEVEVEAFTQAHNELIKAHEVQLTELETNHEAEVKAFTQAHNELITAHEAEVTELKISHETQRLERQVNHAAEVTEYQAIIEQKSKKLQQQADLFVDQEHTYATAYQNLKTEIEAVLTTTV
ncbi:MAG: hypothetical protein ACRC1D_07420, partial [Culicoidibacterales bacterium]